MNHLRRIISFLLVLVLCIGLVPGVSAAEVDTPGADIPTEVTEETAPPTTEDTTPTEESAPEEPPVEEATPEESVSDTENTEPPSEDVPHDGPGIMGLSPGDSSTWAIGSTQKSIMLFDYADNGDYTTRLNSQVACAYKPNGSGTTRTAYIKNLGWHFARYGGVAYADDPLYCIEPWRSYAASTSGNSVDRGVTLDGSGSTTGSNVWYALPAARREAIGLILLYSNQMWNHSISVTTTSKANNPNVPFWVILICIIVIVVTAIGFLTVPAKKDTSDPVGTIPVQDEVRVTESSKDAIEPVDTVPVQDEVNSTILPEAQQINWEDYPDSIRIESYTGETFTAHVMIVRDPSKVYLAASSNPLSMDTPGARMDEAMERENAIAAVNAGPFFDDGTASQAVGSVPSGLALSEDAIIWNDQQISEYDFVGFNNDNILIVASSMTETEAKEQGIRDGCSSGPVLMINGEPNMEVYNGNSGYNPRTAVGQRADGAVVFVCADGRNPDSLGATYADMIDILTEYGAVNACALNGGSSSAMLYRDADGRYGEKGAVQMINRYPLAQSSLRRMPTFWMVKPAG